MSDQFYLTLPSNSSMDLYPDNKISSYKVNLPNTLHLDPLKWEVGLSEIQFVHTWYNVRKGKNIIRKSKQAFDIDFGSTSEIADYLKRSGIIG